MRGVSTLFDEMFGPIASCRDCGYTDHRACVTEEGPCWWVEKDLCSACAGKPQGQAAVADVSAPRPERAEGTSVRAA